MTRDARTSTAEATTATAALLTPHGEYLVTVDEWNRVEKMRSSLLGLMRRCRQMELTYTGTRRVYGDEHPATVARREQYRACDKKREKKAADLAAALVKIEAECQQVRAA